MRNPRIPLLVVFAVAFQATLSGSTSVLSQDEKHTDQSALGFSFEIKGDYRFSVGTIFWHDIIVIIQREKYSKKNLESLFQYFSEKDSNKKQVLRVTVYAGIDAYEHRSEDSNPFGGGIRNQAVYQRICNNEYYFYVPDLAQPNETERVIIKGKILPLPHIDKDCQ